VQVAVAEGSADQPRDVLTGAGARDVRWLVVLLLCLAVWSSWFIYRTSFVVDDVRYFVLFDDAMISMTYARNWLEGYGLNWAREGAPVEGFTHPLWLLLMVPVNALPLAPSKTSLVVQLASLVLLLLHLVAVRALVRDHFSCSGEWHWLPAAAWTAFYYPLAYWALMGMETGAQALLATTATFLALQITERGRDRHLLLWLVLGAAFLLRMDMALLALLSQAWLLRRGGLATGRRSWVIGLLLFVLVVTGYQVFRWLYFGDLLPNTYYLKLTGTPLGVRLARGAVSLWTFLVDHAVPLVAGTPLVIAAWRRFAGTRLALAVVAVYALYAVYVGGDAWDFEPRVRANRFLAFAMPLLFVTANGGLNALLGSRSARLHATVERWSLAAASALGVVVLNGLLGVRHAAESRRDLLVGAPPFAVFGNQVVLQKTLSLPNLLGPGARVATVWAGIPAYFSHYRMVDILGYNDALVARMPGHVQRIADYRLFQPGHDKWNNRDLLRRRPDAFLHTWSLGAGRLRRHGYVEVAGVWLRADSQHLRRPVAAPSERQHGGRS
jgi:hypothetical protein